MNRTNDRVGGRELFAAVAVVLLAFVALLSAVGVLAQRD